MTELGLAVSPEQIRRGQRLDVRLELPEDAGDTPIEVVLACTVQYDVYGLVTLESGERNRSTREDVAWRREESANPAMRVQSIVFELPGNVPYSHAGKALSFAWEVRARQRIPRRRDRESSVALRVLP